MSDLARGLVSGSRWRETGPSLPMPAARTGQRTAGGVPDARARHDILARAITTEVLPRLVIARNLAARAAERPGSVRAPMTTDIVDLATIVMTQDVQPATVFVESLNARGASLETLYLDLLAPAARYLGELWEEDLADFTQVTLGLTRLHQVLRAFGPAFTGEAVAGGRGLHALLTAVPGEQHTFGLMMVGEFFRRGGWTVGGEALSTPREIVAAVRGRWFAVAGFSISSEAKIDALASCIRSVRQASRNPAIGVLVGGPLLVAHPELVPLIGADATASDGRHAVAQAKALLTLLPGRA